MVNKAAYYLLLFFITHLAVISNLCFSQSFRMSAQMRDLIVSGNYTKAESLLLKSENYDPLFLGWLRAKQGKLDALEAVCLSKIEEAKGADRINRIVHYIKIVGDVSAERAEKIANSYLQSDEYAQSLPVHFAFIDILLSKRADQATKEQRDLILKETDLIMRLGRNDKQLVETVRKVALFLYLRSRNNKGEDLELAIKTMLRLLEVFPGLEIDPDFSLQLANYKISEGKRLDALSMLDHIESTYPDFFQKKEIVVRLLRAKAFDEMGEAKRAKQELDKVIIIAKKTKNEAAIVMAESKLKSIKYKQEKR